MRARGRIIAALGIAAAASVGTRGAAAETGIDPVSAACGLPVEETVMAVEALDGDTIRTDSGETIRLAGIEAPKPYGFGDSGLSAAARGALDALVAGQRVKLAFIAAGPDRYGQRHAQAAVGKRWLQEKLVADGQARVRPFAGEDACISALLAVEATARAARRGIWSDGRYGPWRANDPSLSQRNGLYGIVEGRILSVGRGSHMVFLDFGRDYRRDFTIMMTPALADRLAATGLPVEAWVGRSVRVRGVIEDSGGPAIRVDDAVAIEVMGEK